LDVSQLLLLLPCCCYVAAAAVFPRLDIAEIGAMPNNSKQKVRQQQQICCSTAQQR
jgi:hypothetical protein